MLYAKKNIKIVHSVHKKNISNVMNEKILEENFCSSSDKRSSL